MANTFDVHVVSLDLGSFSGATEIPLIYLPTLAGGVTVLSAYLHGADGTAIGGKLVTMTAAGTPAINGTIGAFAGTVVTAAGVPAALTISTPFVDDGLWIGYDQTSGTVPAGTFIALSYVTGK